MHSAHKDRCRMLYMLIQFIHFIRFIHFIVIPAHSFGIHKLRKPPTLQQSHNPSSGPPRGKTGGSHPRTRQNQNLNLSPLKHLWNTFCTSVIFSYCCFPLRSKRSRPWAVPSAQPRRRKMSKTRQQHRGAWLHLGRRAMKRSRGHAMWDVIVAKTRCCQV